MYGAGRYGFKLRGSSIAERESKREAARSSKTSTMTTSAVQLTGLTGRLCANHVAAALQGRDPASSSSSLEHPTAPGR